jgi:D-xylose transport system ATP-binding protein
VSPPLVELRDVVKRFGGVRAVDGASLDLVAGEVLGIVGHNGAGKSSLVRALSGASPLDTGEIRIDGRPVRIRWPRDARRLGIEMVYQDLALAENLDAAANVFLGRERSTPLRTLDDAAMERETRDVIGRINPAFRAFREPVRSLSGGERQTVAIARAVLFQARILILDEPTAALGPAETRTVTELVRRLSAEGLGILLVSHDLHDVLGLADRVAVMRYGRVVAVRVAAGLAEEELVELIVRGAPSKT